MQGTGISRVKGESTIWAELLGKAGSSLAVMEVTEYGTIGPWWNGTTVSDQKQKQRVAAVGGRKRKRQMSIKHDSVLRAIYPDYRNRTAGTDQNESFRKYSCCGMSPSPLPQLFLPAIQRN